MGMDVMHYKVKRTIPVNEFDVAVNEPNFWNVVGENVRVIEVSERVRAWMVSCGYYLGHIRRQVEFDWEVWLKENYQYNDDTRYECYDYDVTSVGEPHWMHFVERETGNAVLLDHKNGDFKYRDVFYLFVEVEEIGYMRKPFRHSEEPIRTEGDAIVLTVTNFSDKGKDGFDILKEIDTEETESANVHIFKMEDLIRLKDCSYDPEYFSKNFIENFEQGDFILFNW